MDEGEQLFTRSISNIIVAYHHSIDSRRVSQPLPHGLVAIRVYDNGREYFQILNQEVAIYGTEAGNCYSHLVATTSAKDASRLVDQLTSIIMLAENSNPLIEKVKSIPIHRDLNRLAEVLFNPYIEFKQDRGIFQMTTFQLDLKEAVRLGLGIKAVLLNPCLSKERAIEIEEQKRPERVVYF